MVGDARSGGSDCFVSRYDECLAVEKFIESRVRRSVQTQRHWRSARPLLRLLTRVADDPPVAAL